MTEMSPCSPSGDGADVLIEEDGKGVCDTAQPISKRLSQVFGVGSSWSKSYEQYSSAEEGSQAYMCVSERTANMHAPSNNYGPLRC